MKKLLVIAVLVCLPVVLMAQTHQKFVQSGKFASVSESITSNGSSLGSFSLSATLNSDSGGTTATIDYSSVSFTDTTFSTLSIVSITGNIPPADLTGTATKTITLNFNTSDLDPNNSFSTQCTLSFITFQETCGAVTPGTISLTFAENDAQETETVLGQDIIMGNITKRIHQRSDAGTATVSGTVFGMSVQSGSGNVGQNHSSTVEVIH